MDAKTRARRALQLAPCPGWCLDCRKGGVQFDIPNAVETPGGPPLSMGEAIGSMTTSPPTWSDFEWIREQWRGPIVAKGVITADDAKRAVAAGVAGIIVSNHGGRQLDGAAESMPALVETLAAGGPHAEVPVQNGRAAGRGRG